MEMIENRTARLTTYLTPQERDAVERLANARGQSAAGLARQLILEYLQSQERKEAA